MSTVAVLGNLRIIPLVFIKKTSPGFSRRHYMNAITIFWSMSRSAPFITQRDRGGIFGEGVRAGSLLELGTHRKSAPVLVGGTEESWPAVSNPKEEGVLQYIVVRGLHGIRRGRNEHPMNTIGRCIVERAQHRSSCDVRRPVL